MVKGAASEVTETAVPTPTEPAPEAASVEEVAQVAEPVAAQEPEPVAQEQKPDVRAILAGLPDEERETILGEIPWIKDRFQRAEQSAEGKAVARIQAEQHRQAKANQDLQQTLQNLDTAADDSQRAQVVNAYARSVLDNYLPQRDHEWREHLDSAFRSTFGLNEGEYKATWIDVHQKAAKENRVATDADFIAHMMGEKFMPKSQMTKDQCEELAAMVEEAVGKRMSTQPGPVSLGPGEPPREPDVATAQGQEAKKAAFREKWGIDALT